MKALTTLYGGLALMLLITSCANKTRTSAVVSPDFGGAPSYFGMSASLLVSGNIHFDLSPSGKYLLTIKSSDPAMPQRIAYHVLNTETEQVILKKKSFTGIGILWHDDETLLIKKTDATGSNPATSVDQNYEYLNILTGESRSVNSKAE